MPTTTSKPRAARPKKTGARPRLSDEAVKKATGKTWDAWCRVLDRAGAGAMTHGEIARLLHAEQGVPGWWSQMVTVGYEQARGRRAVHQVASGRYQVSASRTVGVPVARLFRAWTDARARAGWLPRQKLVVRRSTKDRSMRITWPDGTAVDVGFTAKGPRKSQVAVQHGKLASAEDVETRRAAWKAALDRLADSLSG